MDENYAQTLVLLIALASFVTAFAAKALIRNRVSGIVQVLLVTAFYLAIVVASLTHEEWRDGQTAVGLAGILILDLAAASVGYLCSCLVFRGMGKN